MTYPGNGATTVFSFPFVGVSQDDLEVTYTDATGATSILPASVYTVALNAVPVGGLWGIGGTVTYPNSGAPPVPIAVGTSLTITRILPYEQTVSISNQGAFYPRAVEQGLDLLELQLQQVEADAQQAITTADYALTIAQAGPYGLPILTGFPLTGTFYGSGQPAKMGLNLWATCAESAMPEIGAQFHLESNVGFGNADAYKIGFTSSVNGGAGSAAIVGNNIISTGRAGTGGYIVEGLEINLQNQGASDAGAPASSTASYGTVTTAGGAYFNTASTLTTTSVGSGFTYGHYVTGIVNVPFQGSGTHIKGISFENSTTSLCAMALPNNLIGVMQQDNGGTLRSLLKLDSSNLFQVGYAAGTTVLNGATVFNGTVVPASDNTVDLGSASFRMRTIYAGTGAINTSGRNTKSNIRELNDAEKRVAKRLILMPRIYQFKDAVSEKGDNARLHAGFIYEDVVSVFEDEGLDAMRYGILCSDPAMKVERTSKLKSRVKTEIVKRSDIRIVVKNGKAVQETYEIAEERVVMSDPVPLFNHKGLPVMEKGDLLRDSDGELILSNKGKPQRSRSKQKMHQEPVMETYEETEERTVPDLDENGNQKTIVGLRYSELMVFILAGLNDK